MAEISQEELDSRVALLHRFKDLLSQQRSKFQEYLTVLEKQQDSIAAEDTEHLIAHTELEQQVVQNIANLQKVIIPMQKMYRAEGLGFGSEGGAGAGGKAFAGTGAGAGDRADAEKAENIEITTIQNELNDLQNKVLKQNEINRDLLRVHLEQLKEKMANFKNPYKNVRSVYANSQPKPVATLVSVEV